MLPEESKMLVWNWRRAEFCSLQITSACSSSLAAAWKSMENCLLPLIRHKN